MQVNMMDQDNDINSLTHCAEVQLMITTLTHSKCEDNALDARRTKLRTVDGSFRMCTRN